MLREPAIEKLKLFGLHAMADAWIAQQAQPEIEALSFNERFGLLIDAEWLHRENMRLGRAQAPRFLEQLRGWLDAHLADATLATAARSLARSRRSLQRDLHSAHSSFQHELITARVQRAQHLLIGSGRSLTEIAHEIGCASLQHFSGMFRQYTGETPSVWRARRR